MTDFLRIMIGARLSTMRERGASAVEYGLLIAGIAALIIAVVFIFGSNISSLFGNTCAKVTSSNGAGTNACT